MEGISEIRLSLGGAGFSTWSSLPYIFDDFSSTPTLEGDNTVMAMQTTNYL
jgi:hypothetical protein